MTRLSTTPRGGTLASIARALDGISDRIERATVLDGPARLVAKVVDRALPRGVTREVASGVPTGHPLHPLLVAIPIGSWSAATWLDLTGGDRGSAQRLIALGIASALPTAATGGNDWLSTSGAEQRAGLTHALLNDVALVLYASSWLARHRGRHAKGVLLALAGFAVTGGAGWLGGHLAYAMGVGVDTTAFQQIPADWTDVAAESAVSADQPMEAEAAGVPVLLARLDDRIVALADRCTHRGGPLHEGEITDGCIICPWHNSVFDLDDGSVVSGPATRPQPVAEVRILDGRVQVRRSDEVRDLRTNPIGH